MVINITIRVAAEQEAKARYTFDFLSTHWGVPVRFVEQPQVGCNVVYGTRKDTDGDALHLACDAKCYSPPTPFVAVRANGSWMWAPTECSVTQIDLVGSIFRLLTFLDESQVAEGARDRRGNFTTEALPPARRSVAAVPLVDIQAERLFTMICRTQPQLRRLRLPRWPEGRKYAFLLSHDTDAITLGAAGEMTYNLAKAVLRRDAISFRMFISGFKYLRRPNQNPLFGFPRWRALEGKRLRSCFYLFVRSNGVKRELNDCRSSVDNQPINWSILCDMADDGWEFGVHASIHTKDKLALLTSRKYVEDKIGHTVAGIRHHYWAIDWRRPQSTFRNQAQAGFRYDASIAWRDIAGFRAATCLPFHPFDLDSNQPVDIYEVPTALMDGHIRSAGKTWEENAADGLTVIEKIKQNGGIAFLDWHTECACNDYCYRGDVSVLDRILESVLGDSEAWITTPENLIRHWRERSLRLTAASQEATAAIAVTSDVCP